MLRIFSENAAIGRLSGVLLPGGTLFLGIIYIFFREGDLTSFVYTL